ncbi:MAG: hypothetical protein PVS2B2_16840 [Candidatus Acidiferrum sp.]
MKKQLFSVALFSMFGMAAFGQALHTEAKLDSPVPLDYAITCESGTELAAIGHDGAIYVWTLPSGQPRKISVPDGRVSSMACAGRKTLVAGFVDGKVLVLDLESGDVRQRIDAKFPMHAVALSPDGSLIAIATIESPTQLWSAHTGQKLSTGVTKIGASTSAAFSPNGDMFVSTDGDTYIRAYDRNGKLLYSADGGLLEPFAVTFGGDGKQFAVAGAEGVISLFDTATGKKLKSSINTGNPIFGLQMSPDGQDIAALELDEFTLEPAVIGLWDTRSGGVKPLAVEAKNVIGTGTSKSHLLLIRREGPRTLTICSVQ